MRHFPEGQVAGWRRALGMTESGRGVPVLINLTLLITVHAGCGEERLRVRERLTALLVVHSRSHKREAAGQVYSRRKPVSILTGNDGGGETLLDVTELPLLFLVLPLHFRRDAALTIPRLTPSVPPKV